MYIFSILNARNYIFFATFAFNETRNCLAFLGSLLMLHLLQIYSS